MAIDSGVFKRVLAQTANRKMDLKKKIANKSQISDVAKSSYALKKEAKNSTQLLKGKVVEKILRPRSKEMAIQFTDGTRLFVDIETDGLDLSITGD
jgi:hypothetical protein